MHLYADDTVLYSKANTKFWIEIMVFPRSHNLDYLSLHISTTNGSNIERVMEYKHLDIWLDDKFTFKFHIRNIIGKLWQKIYTELRPTFHLFVEDGLLNQRSYHF